MIAILAGPDGPSAAPVGRMRTEGVCAQAGEGMVRLLAAANPDLTFGWRCMPGVAT